MGLKLLANDGDDLKVVASAVQDAILRVGDIRYDPVGRAVTLRLSRFTHERDASARQLSGLRIDGVMAMRSRGVDRAKSDAYAVLLDIAFTETDAPGGTLTLAMAGGGEIQCDVEALDLLLADIGEARATRSTPDHDTA